MRRNTSHFDTFKELKTPVMSRLSLGSSRKSDSVINKITMTKDFWSKTQVNTPRRTNSVIVEKVQQEIKKIKARRESPSKKEEPKNDDSFEKNYDRVEGKFSSKFAGNFNIPRSKFQLATCPD